MGSRSFPEVAHLHSVKVDGISCRQEEVVGVKEELREKFEKFGDVGDVYIPRDRNFAFVRYKEKRDAEDAIDAMDGKEIMGQKVNCSMSQQAKKAPEDYPDRGRGGRSRSRGGQRGSTRGRGRERSRDRSADYSESYYSPTPSPKRRRRRDEGKSRRRRDDSREPRRRRR
mmetsp:Transcript_25231/g.40392  ORF Transcript_25231/g.40392 Transcript_25231/m.40392 type:complete len:170 (+) Transcript_25231:137-646(+)